LFCFKVNGFKYIQCVGGLLAVGAVAATMFLGYKLIKAITKEKEPEQRSNTVGFFSSII
jgi:hypothetical protein